MNWYQKFLAIAALVLCPPAIAQNLKEMPEFEGEINVVAAGQVSALERQNGRMEFKAPAFGIGMPKSVSRVTGNRSPIRLRSGQPVYFVVRTSQYSNPADSWQLNPLESKGKFRQLTTMSIGLGGSRDRRMESAIPLTFQRHGKTGFRITPASPLPPGEYAFSLLGFGTSLSLFGVD